MCWHPWDLGEESSLGGGGSAECTWSFCRICLVLFSFLGQEEDATPGYLKARVPLVTVSMPHAWIPGPRDVRQATTSKSDQLSAGVAGNSYVPHPRATCPAGASSTGLLAGGGAEKDSVPHTGCSGDKGENGDSDLSSEGSHLPVSSSPAIGTTGVLAPSREQATLLPEFKGETHDLCHS